MCIIINGKIGSGYPYVCKLINEKFKCYSEMDDLYDALNKSLIDLYKDFDHNIMNDNETSDEEDAIIYGNYVFNNNSMIKLNNSEKNYKVFLTVDPIIAAKRVEKNFTRQQKSSINYDKVSNIIEEVYSSEIIRIKNECGLIIDNMENYNLVLDTTYSSLETIVNIILEHIANSIEINRYFLSPKSLYPLESIMSINNSTLNYYFECYKAKEYVDPVQVIYYNNYFYILEGIHRALAAVINREDLLEVKLIRLNDHSRIKDEDALRSIILDAGLSSVFDYECLGDFRYSSYPIYYKK